MTETIEKTIERNTRKYKDDLAQIEQIIKKWEVELKLHKFNDDCAESKRLFIELQCELTKIKDDEVREKHQKKCYEITDSFLSFIERNWDPANFEYAYTHPKTTAFPDMWEYFNTYCKNTENKYSWAHAS